MSSLLIILSIHILTGKEKKKRKLVESSFVTSADLIKPMKNIKGLVRLLSQKSNQHWKYSLIGTFCLLFELMNAYVIWNKVINCWSLWDWVGMFWFHRSWMSCLFIIERTLNRSWFCVYNKGRFIDSVNDLNLKWFTLFI